MEFGNSVSPESLLRHYGSCSPLIRRCSPSWITALLVFPRSRSAEYEHLLWWWQQEKPEHAELCCCDGLWDECENMQTFLWSKPHDTVTAASGNSFSESVCVWVTLWEWWRGLCWWWHHRSAVLCCDVLMSFSWILSHWAALDWLCLAAFHHGSCVCFISQ